MNNILPLLIALKTGYRNIENSLSKNKNFYAISFFCQYLGTNTIFSKTRFFAMGLYFNKKLDLRTKKYTLEIVFSNYTFLREFLTFCSVLSIKGHLHSLFNNVVP